MPAFYTAGIYLRLKDNQNSLVWLNKAYQERYEGMIYFKLDPAVNGLRTNPGFKDLMQKTNLQ